MEQGIYQQPNGKYAVCFMVEGKLRIVPAAPRLRFARVAGWWVERYERRVEAGERRERTLEHHRYHLNKHLLPILGQSLMRAITVAMSPT